MKAISDLLDSLNERINIISSQADLIKNKRNQILEIENIFFKYQIPKSDIAFDDLIKISLADFSRIMEIMEESNIATLTEKFDDNIKLIELYKTLTSDLNEIPEAVQYEEAKDWLIETTSIINEYITSSQVDQTQHINILENSIASIRKFTDLFKGGELSTPILDITEFHDVLNKCGFDLPTKVEIKKKIGQTNYTLVYSEKEEVNELDKYSDVYEKKRLIYKEDIAIVLELIEKESIKLSIKDALDQILSITEFTKLPYKNVQNAVACILLKEELTESFNKDNIEEIINISKHVQPKDESSSSLVTTANETLKQANEIISLENSLVKPNNELKYFELATAGDKENNELTLSIIVDSINQNSELLTIMIKDYEKYPDIYERKCKELILNITEYIESYNIIKTRINETTPKEK